MSRLLAAALVCAAPILAGAQLSSRGHIGIEGRAFQPDDDEITDDFGLGLIARLQLSNRHRPFKEQLRVFARVDSIDSERNIVILEEARVLARTGGWRAQIGAQMLDWTATEAFHPADVINSRNLDSNLEAPEKLGEPMISFALRLWDGELAVHYMPVRIGPIMPGASSRLSFLPPGETVGHTLWVAREGAITRSSLALLQWAATVSQTFGPVDLAVHVVQHSDRSQPTTVIDTQALTGHPLHHQVTHVGMTGVWAEEYFSIKLEGAYRMFDAPGESLPFAPLFDRRVPEDHAQVALGLEIGWEWESGHDSTWLLEGQAVLGPDEVARAPEPLPGRRARGLSLRLQRRVLERADPRRHLRRRAARDPGQRGLSPASLRHLEPRGGPEDPARPVGRRRRPGRASAAPPEQLPVRDRQAQLLRGR